MKAPSHVLIVDDSLTVRMNLAEAFDAVGFEATACGTLAAARIHLQRRQFSVVILDVNVGDEDGTDLLRELRSNGQKGPPFVLMLSSEAEVHDRIRGMQTGADDYVGKPYDLSYLIARSQDLISSGQRNRHEPSTTVLIVDDSPTFREELRGALEAANFSVVTASSGEEGLRLASVARPLAILVDSMMPGIDGSTMIRKLRLDAALRGTPCVLLTASDDRDTELDALDAGADAFVRKADMELILARLTAVLRSASADLVPSSGLSGPKRILLVDDSITYANELSAMLQVEGYEVVTARSGQECLDLVAAQAIDCVLVDLHMEGLDGVETCRILKRSSAHRDIPTIVLTASEERSAMIDALGSGADDFIFKSSEAEVLKARVRAQLRRKQFEDERRHIRERLLKSELAAAEARAAQEWLAARARLVEELERKNAELTCANADLQLTQQQLVQSAKMASLGELVAGVAHEINNPLAFVISHLSTVKRNLHVLDEKIRQFILNDDLPHWERAQDRLHEMDGGLVRMHDLVLKLRSFSRIDEGEIKCVSLKESIESLLMILSHRCTGRINIETAFGEPDEIECYAGLLNQAIMNLVSNAIDAIEGKGTIRVTTEAAGDNCMICVIDDGSGISDHLRERVLEPFFTTKPVGEGTGLGLSITYSIMKKHGGSVELGPNPSGGTRATLMLPLRQNGLDGTQLDEPGKGAFGLLPGGTIKAL